MGEKWRNVWNSKPRVDDAVLEFLLKIDGFDTGPGSFSARDWRKYTSHIYNLLNIAPKDSIYEVGCGAGAFLYPLSAKGYAVSGIDYSQELVYWGNKVLENASVVVGDAAKMETDIKFDVVVSHGVFLYFSSLEYAKTVTKLMVSKSIKSANILDVNDYEKKDEYEEERIRIFCQKGGNREDYLKKYDGLAHLFYPKNFFREIAIELGISVEIQDQVFSEYGNSGFRYNVIFKK